MLSDLNPWRGKTKNTERAQHILYSSPSLKFGVLRRFITLEADNQNLERFIQPFHRTILLSSSYDPPPFSFFMIFLCSDDEFLSSMKILRPTDRILKLIKQK